MAVAGIVLHERSFASSTMCAYISSMPGPLRGLKIGVIPGSRSANVPGVAWSASTVVLSSLFLRKAVVRSSSWRLRAIRDP